MLGQKSPSETLTATTYQLAACLQARTPPTLHSAPVIVLRLICLKAEAKSSLTCDDPYKGADFLLPPALQALGYPFSHQPSGSQLSSPTEPFFRPSPCVHLTPQVPLPGKYPHPSVTLTHLLPLYEAFLIPSAPHLLKALHNFLFSYVCVSH